MSYERLRKQIADNNQKILTSISRLRQESVDRDGLLYKSVQRQGIYMEAIIEYDKRYWWIPKGIYFGQKLLDKLVQKKFDDLQKSELKASKEAQKKVEEKIKKYKEEAERNKSKIIIPGKNNLSVVGGGN